MESIFNKIIKKEIPAKVYYEDEKVIAIDDVKPKRPGHFLVIPKTFSNNLIDIEDEDYMYLMKISKKLAKKRIKELNVSGFNLVVNNGENAGQEVFHTHIHIIPSRK